MLAYAERGEELVLQIILDGLARDPAHYEREQVGLHAVVAESSAWLEFEAALEGFKCPVEIIMAVAAADVVFLQAGRHGKQMLDRDLAKVLRSAVGNLFGFEEPDKRVIHRQQAVLPGEAHSGGGKGLAGAPHAVKGFRAMRRIAAVIDHFAVLDDEKSVHFIGGDTPGRIPEFVGMGSHSGIDRPRKV